MRKLLVFVAIGALAMCLFGCASGEAEPAEPLNLDGTWVQTNSNSEDSWQEAVIEGDTITVNWVSPDSVSLYWAGSYVAPDTTEDSYAWTSENDTEKTSVALLASTADTKDFSYEGGELSYEASAFGTTVTVRMERQE